MGMYPAYKEIRASTLAALMADPMNAAHVDGLLFEPSDDEAARWSREASRAESIDSARFTRPELGEPSELLGGLNLGKYPDWDTELPFCYLLGAHTDEALVKVLEILSADENPDVTAKKLEAFTPAKLPLRQHRSMLNHTEVIGFDTDVICYGINGHRTLEDLTGIWRRIEQFLERHAKREDDILDVAREEIAYYYGCAARQSADLYVVW